jgi:hypothetical protein
VIGRLSKRLPCAKQLVCGGRKRRKVCSIHVRVVLCRGIRFAAITSLLMVSLTACQGVSGNAFAGPNPGGGTPCPHNAFEDCAER